QSSRCCSITSGLQIACQPQTRTIDVEARCGFDSGCDCVQGLTLSAASCSGRRRRRVQRDPRVACRGERRGAEGMDRQPRVAGHKVLEADDDARRALFEETRDYLADFETFGL